MIIKKREYIVLEVVKKKTTTTESRYKNEVKKNLI